jgi:BlaI family transcriptional regulator, penicillinase repressor
MRKPHPTLTTQELALMKIVWRRRTATVREVYEDLRETRRIAYTTVMTMMNVLAAKGYVTRTKDDRAFRYRPAQQERTVVTSMVREFVNRVFDGASRPLLLHLSKDRNLTAKERQELRRLIEEAE